MGIGPAALFQAPSQLSLPALLGLFDFLPRFVHRLKGLMCGGREVTAALARQRAVAWCVPMPSLMTLCPWQAREFVGSLPWVRDVNVVMDARSQPLVAEGGGRPRGLRDVAHVIAVSSCKVTALLC